MGQWPCTYVHLINTLNTQAWSVINTRRPQICFTGGNLSRTTRCKLLICLHQPRWWYSHRAQPEVQGSHKDQQIAPAWSQQDTVLFSHPFPRAQASSLTENNLAPGLPVPSTATPNPQPEVILSLNPTARDFQPTSAGAFSAQQVTPYPPEECTALIHCKIEFSHTPQTLDLPCTIYVKKKKPRGYYKWSSFLSDIENPWCT